MWKCALFADWGPKVDVVGFCFLNLATNYRAPEDLLKWLKAGPPPIYIGFGSLVSYPYHADVLGFECANLLLCTLQFFSYALSLDINICVSPSNPFISIEVASGCTCHCLAIVCLSQ